MDHFTVSTGVPEQMTKRVDHYVQMMLSEHILVGGFKHFFHFIYGNISFPYSYFSEGLVNHQPVEFPNSFLDMDGNQPTDAGCERPSESCFQCQRPAELEAFSEF